MTEVRNCKTCKYSSKSRYNCYNVVGECNRNNSKWQPIAQEKPMENKVIFESEEQAREVVKLLVCHDDNCMYEKDECIECDMRKLRKTGLIRKSAVDEAEEMYNNYMLASSPYNISDVVLKQYEAIQELKSEIERLKK